MYETYTDPEVIDPPVERTIRLRPSAAYNYMLELQDEGVEATIGGTASASDFTETRVVKLIFTATVVQQAAAIVRYRKNNTTDE
ncbi:MAG TPA: hypothetical protein VF572_00715 [Candidatus Saccharimonadales bacterium]|jgi:hypothetical protein